MGCIQSSIDNWGPKRPAEKHLPSKQICIQQAIRLLESVIMKMVGMIEACPVALFQVCWPQQHRGRHKTGQTNSATSSNNMQNQ